MELKSIVLIVVVILVIYVLFRYMFQDINTLQQNVVNGQNLTTIQASTLATNGTTAATNNFAYSIWFYVNDWNYRYGEPKVIYGRMGKTSSDGSGSIDNINGLDPCPTVVLGAIENNLSIALGCYPGLDSTTSSTPITGQTNILLADSLMQGAINAGLPKHTIQIVRTPGHEAVSELLAMDNYIDVLIPRGGKALIQRIAEGTRIPVIKHYDGLCHLYIAEDADPSQAIALAVNSKCQSIQVCNALETLLVDRACAEQMLPLLKNAFDTNTIELRGCEITLKLLQGISPATEDDWHTEYLAPILSIKIVSGIDEAIQHINHYGSGHTDGIVTQNLSRAQKFEQQVDSASVLINASTRLSGGGDYGLGSVIGISTDKLHARGPVGPDELTTYKWVVYGEGHLRN
jgi:hypothetical protein